MAAAPMKMMSKSSNLECCMCGDLGLSHLLFRCAVCHFRSQHRYCSNLYPKAETYKVCNWCLVNKDNVDDGDQLNNLTISSINNSDGNNKKIIKLGNSHHNHTSGPSPKRVQPTSPFKKPPVQPRSPSCRKRVAASKAVRTQEEQGDNVITRSSMLRRSKSTSYINVQTAKKKSSNDDNNNNNNKKSENVNVSRRNGGVRDGNGGPKPTTMTPSVIKHVFRNKVRRYKLLDEVSC